MRIALLLLFWVPMAFAGDNGWVSLGGDLYRSDKNPWFVRNTTTVNYCVTVDGGGVSASVDDVRKSVRAALEYWKDELVVVNATNNQVRPANGNQASLGEQTFVESPCSAKTDLQFVIGAGALRADQRASIPNVRRSLGRTTRTSYDFEQLRGRGFIFVASDIGPERFQSLTGNRRLWSLPNALKAILAHELGHVFGLPHFGSGLMAESFAEKLTTPLAGFFLAQGDLPPVLSPHKASRSCQNGPAMLKWLGVNRTVTPPERICLTLTAQEGRHKDDQVKPAVFKLYVHGEKESPVEELGEIAIDTVFTGDDTEFPFDLNVSISSLIFLGPEQKVFRQDERMEFPDPRDPTKKLRADFLFATGEVKFGQRATLTLKSGLTKNVFFHLEPAGYKIHADVDGQTRVIFNSDSVFMF